MIKFAIATAVALLLAGPALAGGGGHMGGGGATGIGIGTGISSSQSSGNRTSFRDRLQAPAVAAPALATAIGCEAQGTRSAGVSGAGFGVSFGTTTNDTICKHGYMVRLLVGLGHKKEALQYLVDTDQEVRDAFFPKRK